MKIEEMSVKDVIPYDKNPRNNNESIGFVMKSLKEFGFRQPIVVDKDKVIIIGHTRLQAAINLGFTHVPVHIASDLSPGKLKALRLADNKAGEKSFWDLELVREEINELPGLEFDTSMMEFGFESFEVNSVFGDNEEEPDDTPADDDLPPATNTGDSLKIRFEDVAEKSEAYIILGVDPKKRVVNWSDVKRALDL